MYFDIDVIIYVIKRFFIRRSFKAIPYFTSVQPRKLGTEVKLVL